MCYNLIIGGGIINIKETIGNNLKKMRIKKNLTQEDIAQKLTSLKYKNENNNYIPITRATISKYENGKLSISIDTLIDLAEILNVPINSFFDTIYNDNFKDKLEEIYKDEDGYTICFHCTNGLSFDSLNLKEKERIIQKAMDELYEIKRSLKNK